MHKNAITLFLVVTLTQSGGQLPQGDTSPRRRQLSPEECAAETQVVMSRAYVQVPLLVGNRKGAPLVIPVFEGNELFWMYSFVEQKRGNPPKWQREVRTLPTEGFFDVVLPDKRILLKPGDSTMLLYRFNPGDVRLQDGKPLGYPGRVRVVFLAWLDDKWIGFPEMDFEVASDEFEIPPPPQTWGRRARQD